MGRVARQAGDGREQTRRRRLARRHGRAVASARRSRSVAVHLFRCGEHAALPQRQVQAVRYRGNFVDREIQLRRRGVAFRAGTELQRIDRVYEGASRADQLRPSGRRLHAESACQEAREDNRHENDAHSLQGHSRSPAGDRRRANASPDRPAAGGDADVRDQAGEGSRGHRQRAPGVDARGPHAEGERDSILGLCLARRMRRRRHTAAGRRSPQQPDRAGRQFGRLSRAGREIGLGRGVIERAGISRLDRGDGQRRRPDLSGIRRAIGLSLSSGSCCGGFVAVWRFDQSGRTAMPSIRIIAAALVALCSSAAAQDWPTRPVTMVVPFAAGGAFDVLARVFAPYLSMSLGQQVIVENVGAAAGIVGTNRVAKATPDGYVFLFGSVGTHAYNQTLYKKLPYNAATDFAPVALLVEQPMVLLTGKDFPADNLQQFIAYAKANAAKLQYGSAGVGSTTHLSCALLNTAAGLDITHVPYRGGGPVMADLIAGQVHYMCSNSAGALPQITSNTLKGIALLARSRSPLLPTLATAHEQGLADFEAITWNAFFMPKGTPSAIVKKLHDATIEAMNTPALKDRMHELGVSLVAPERRSPEYLQTFVESEIAKWGAPIKAAGISAD